TAAMRDAVAVVCHGGPATICQARAVGHVPIVVPRRSSLGEHVDDHQVRFGSWMADRGTITLVLSEVELREALDKALADPTSVRIPPGEEPGVDASALFGDLVDVVTRPRQRER